MSNTIQIKRSSTAASVPTAGQLAVGELAVNLADRKLYTKNASNAVVSLTPDATPTGGFSFRNRLINAQGLINQRGYVSGTATTSANQYTVDRWRVVGSGQNLTFTTTNNEVTFTAPAGGVEQVIEGLNLESGTYVLNWEGTATATVGGTAVAKGGTVTVVGGTNTTVRFIGGTFIRPQFEAGSVATPFERRPFATELALCQRYYEKSYNVSVVPGTTTDAGNVTNGGVLTATTTGTIALGYAFRVPKRANPTMTSWDMNGNINKCDRSEFGVAGNPNQTFSFSVAGENSFLGESSGTATANGIRMHFTAVAEL
jgi:acyl-coenzyme A thioesterase PaaI-like protein